MDQHGEKPEHKAEQTEVWPHLVFRELIAMLVVSAVLIAVSLYVEAPLEGMANPSYTPRVAKAPWYFVGLQELLVYFDPWIAGVMLPGIIIVGLMALPFIDRGAHAIGEYSPGKRPLAWGAFLFGLALWFGLIAIGEFARGPHWAWYWPTESWDIEKGAAPASVDLPLIPGLAASVCYLLIGIGLPAWWWPSFRRRLGWLRYLAAMVLLLGMCAVPLKIVLRLAFNIHYVFSTPWFNF